MTKETGSIYHANTDAEFPDVFVVVVGLTLRQGGEVIDANEKELQRIYRSGLPWRDASVRVYLPSMRDPPNIPGFLRIGQTTKDEALPEERAAN